MHWFVWPIVYLICFGLFESNGGGAWQIVSEDAPRCCILRKFRSGSSWKSGLTSYSSWKRSGASSSPPGSHTHSHVQIELSKAL